VSAEKLKGGGNAEKANNGLQRRVEREWRLAPIWDGLLLQKPDAALAS
jgi:hypothetical protein